MPSFIASKPIECEEPITDIYVSKQQYIWLAQNSPQLKPGLIYHILQKKKIVQCFGLRHLAPFDWKVLQIGTLNAKNLRKN